MHFLFDYGVLWATFMKKLLIGYCYNYVLDDGSLLSTMVVDGTNEKPPSTIYHTVWLPSSARLEGVSFN